MVPDALSSFVFPYPVTTRTLLCIIIILRTGALSVHHARKTAKKLDVVCTHNSSGSRSSATPTANQSSSSRSTRFLLSSFGLHPHDCYHAVYLAVRCESCAAGNK